MQLETRIATHTAEINPVEWDRLSAHRPFTSYDWYRMGETVLAPIPRWYVQVYDAGELIARATFWLARDEPLPISGLERFAVNVILSMRPLIICRSPLSFLPGLILPQDERKNVALQAINDAALQIAAEKRASFTAFDFLDPSLLDINWQALGYSRVDIPVPGTVLKVEHSSFEDYQSGLSKSTYKDYRRHRNQAAARGIVVTCEDRVTDPKAAMTLVRQVERRHGSMPTPWAQALLEYGSRGGVSWLSVRQDGRLVGCGLILRDQGVHLATLLGLDYRVEYVYFQLMYAAIRHAIEQGALALRAGSGAYSLKQRLGFQLEDNHHLLYSGCGRFFQQLGRKLGDYGGQ